jgi:hypothetical protein
MSGEQVDISILTLTVLLYPLPRKVTLLARGRYQLSLLRVCELVVSF